LYKEFFQRFKKEKLFTAEEIVERETDCKNPLEDSFL
jgi:hypothetical protein